MWIGLAAVIIASAVVIRGIRYVGQAMEQGGHRWSRR